jgi:hypothetical protein
MHQYQLLRLLYGFISGEEAHSTRKSHVDTVPVLVLMKIATKTSMATCFGSEVYGQPTRRNVKMGATKRNAQLTNRCKNVCGIVIAPCHS